MELNQNTSSLEKNGNEELLKSSSNLASEILTVTREVRKLKNATEHLLLGLLAAVDSYNSMGYKHIESDVIIELLDKFKEEIR